LPSRAEPLRHAAVRSSQHRGTIEPHAATEARLLALDVKDHGLFAAGQSKRLAAAYRHRAQAVAYRRKPPAPARATRKK
jgi:hypothetical protein